MPTRNCGSETGRWREDASINSVEQAATKIEGVAGARTKFIWFNFNNFFRCELLSTCMAGVS